MSEVQERADIPGEYKWDLEAIFASDEDWETAFEEAEALIEELAAFEGEATADGETLLAVLEQYEAVGREVERVANYARMRRDEDTRNETYQAMASRAQTLAASARSAAGFIEPALQDLDADRLAEMVESVEGLADYDHYFDDVRRQAEHTRSAEVETLLADLGEVTSAPGNIYGMLADADIEFPTVEDPEGEPVEVTNASFTVLQKRPDREFRRRVYEAYYDRWHELKHTVAATYENSVTADVKLARARGYETAREAALDGPNIPVEVYDTLLSTVRDNLDALHRHAELKAAAVGADELAMWDVYVPLARGEEPEVGYEEARSHVVEALGALGDDYRSRVAAGFDSRWVDVYENRGKRAGAYSGGGYDTQPYILMNYQDDVNSMYTLAHEFGHSLHSQLTSEHQPYVYYGYEIFVAEVASTVNEALLTHHLLETVEDETLRRYVLDQYLERFRSTLYRQAMFADFELATHEVVEEGGALTPGRLEELYGDRKSAFYEPAAVDDRIAREWMRIPHFYRAFYVFQYSTGISAAVALARDILEEGEPAAERYLAFLKRGSRDYPLELLREAGVDMSTAAPVEAAIDEYREYLGEMAELV